MLILPGIRVHFGGQLDVRLRLLFLLLVPLAGVGQRGLALGVAVLRGRLVVGEARLELLQPGVVLGAEDVAADALVVIDLPGGWSVK